MTKLTRKAMTVSAVLLLAVLGCNGNNGFSSNAGTSQNSGDAKGQDPAKSLGSDTSNSQANNTADQKAPSPDDQNANISNALQCGPNGVTKVTLLTPSVASRTPGSHLDYEISAVDCNGKPIKDLVGNIDFDIGASTDKGDNGFPYRFLDDAEQKAGVFGVVHNGDLFGNTGGSFRFFRIATPVHLSATQSSVKIRVDLLGAEIESYTPEDIRNGTLATYLRFGQAAPVKQSVKLLNPGRP